MSKHYCAYQYEAAYRPKALCNWEVPQYYCDRPRQRSGKTSIIANSRGHILPGVPRPQSNPWGNFIGTWHLPNKITRSMADVINGSTEGKLMVQKCLEQAKHPIKYAQSTIKPDKKVEEKSEEKAPSEKSSQSPKEAITSSEIDDLESTKIVRRCPIHDL